MTGTAAELASSTVSPLNKTAKSFKALHQPGNPLLLTNVWNLPTAELISSIPGTKALATASFAMARDYGLEDDDLDLEKNLETTAKIAAVAKAKGLPLTADFQDGYGDQLEEGVGTFLELGVVGVNIEDYVPPSGNSDGRFYSTQEACDRIRRVLAVARDAGVPDFVVNARTDALLYGLTLEDAIQRGKAYLDAGATTVYAWGRQRGLRTEEVKRLVEAFDGRLNVKYIPGGLTVGELAEMGVARISLGPGLMRIAEAAIVKEAERIMGQTREKQEERLRRAWNYA